MKTGDKLICKKDLINQYHEYIKGNEYLIKVRDDTIDTIVLISQDNDFFDTLKYMAFNYESDFDYYKIWDYFYTKEELRLLKINSL